MALKKVFKLGTKVRYKDAAGRVFPAVVTAVTSQTVLSMRVGNGAGKFTCASITKKAKTLAGPSWFQGS